MKIIKNVAFALSSLLIFTEFSSAEDDLFLDDLPIVISASRLNQSVLTSPASVTVIDKAMIEASGFIEFADLLRLIPGFQVAHVDGRRYSVVYHGNGSDISNRIQVLVNGRSTYTPSLSTVNWDSLGLQLEDIEKIEVVRGTSASAYGSNSFTAAINIITRSPELDDNLTLQLRGGNKGERNLLLRHSGSLGNFHYRITGASRQSDGFDNMEDGKEFNHLGFHGRINTQNNNPINIYLAYTDGVTDTRENDDLLLERDVEITSWNAHIQGGNIISNTQDIKWNIYHNEDNVNDLSQTRLLSDIISEQVDFTVSPADFEAFTGNPDTRTIEGSETNDASKTDMELIYSSSQSKNIQYSIGSGVRYDTLTSASYFREQGQLSETTYRVFGNSQTPITSTVTFNTGALYEYNESYKGRTSPRASLNWQFTPNQSLRLAAARGYRFPSILEKNFDTRTTLPNGFVIDERFNSDENLKPEKIDGIDIGYLGKLQRLPVSWDIKLYREKISDIITFAEVEETTTILDTESRFATNGGRITSYGMEGELSYRPSIDSFLKFHFHLARSTFEVLTNIDPDEIEESDKNIPRQTYGLLAGLKLNNWQINSGVYYLGDMEWYNQGGEIKRYTRIDVSVARTIKINNKNNIKIKLVAQNIGGEHAEFGNEDASDNSLLFEPRYYLKTEFTLF